MTFASGTIRTGSSFLACQKSTAYPELTVATRDKNAAIVAEDEAVLTAQQIAMEENPDAVFYNLNIDGGAMWARRVLEQMLATETPPALRAAE